MNGEGSGPSDVLVAPLTPEMSGSRRPDLPGVRKLPDKGRPDNLCWSPCSDCSSDDNNSPTALNSFDWDKPELGDKTVDFGWTPTHKANGKALPSNSLDKLSSKKPSGYINLQSVDQNNITDCRISGLKGSPKIERELKQSCDAVIGSFESKKLSFSSDFKDSILHSSRSDGSRESLLEGDTVIDERKEEEILQEKEELKKAAWFQAGIPREIALEVLSEKPEGSFIVRESTTKHGCYALSLRVPPGKNPAGIAHYLILRTSKGYKIKGFTKEFRSLNALITHHSVMPELLPCPLAHSRPSRRDAEREFEETEVRTCDLFEDIHWIMDDLHRALDV